MERAEVDFRRFARTPAAFPEDGGKFGAQMKATRLHEVP